METNMPNKTIYVSEDDLPLFERAQAMAGNSLSSAIVSALRRFIEVEEARQGGVDEITVPVGMAGNLRWKRFLGVHLVRWLNKSATGKGTDILNVYRTAKGRLVLHTRTVSDWEPSGGDPEGWGDPRNWGIWKSKIWRGGRGFDDFKLTGDFSFEIYESLGELKAHVPRDVYKAVTLALEGPPLEDLDI